MKVKELIEELAKCNPDAPVEVMNKTNGNYRDVVDVKKCNPQNSVAPVKLIAE